MSESDGVKASSSPAPWLVAAIVGGLVCLVGDHLHVSQGVLFYPHPDVWQQAWWVFPLFFFSTLAVVAGAKLANPSASSSPWRTLIADAVAFAAAYAFTAFASPFPNLVLVVLLAAWGLRIARGMPVRLVCVCFLTAIAGTVFEITLSGSGGFTYLHPDFLGVPRWLPVLYLHAAVAGASVRVMLAPGARTTDTPPAWA
jgi:hypothetical protein